MDKEKDPEPTEPIDPPEQQGGGGKDSIDPPEQQGGGG